MPDSLTAFELLLEIDQRCRSLAAGLAPAQVQADNWSGIGFRIGEHCFVAIMDLCGFFGVELSPLRKQRRVLVLEYKEIFVGLQVDEVLGMQHFAHTDLDSNVQALPHPMFAPYVQGHFAGNPIWWVFSPFVLAQAPQFWAVAV